QVEPQVRLSPPQTQLPCEQVWPSGHSTPTHALSWHVPSAHTAEGGQLTLRQLCTKHPPFAQAVPPSHAVPQLPQFLSSVFRSAQTPPHDVVGAVQLGPLLPPPAPPPAPPPPPLPFGEVPEQAAAASSRTAARARIAPV